ncbi:hypothetical protein ROZALSC1DRAFT_26934 [Rozella allomycis CSF55]|uniref:Cache domain-containing protein n=1 Tax=Rozella allomycis (strain CSF55) TaxID=988480 RepID=A0A4V1J0I5_ROZAC|nr:hypothetical protein ROZALSC1DRAFT_26934 [Rozella allomycis CSF55]
MNFLLPVLLNSQDMVSSQTFTTKYGELWGFYTYFGSNLETKYGMWEHYGLNSTEYEVDKLGNIIDVNFNTYPANYTENNWVIVVNKSDPESSAWVASYVWSDSVWISHSVALFDSQNEYVGVYTIDMILNFINSILSTRSSQVSNTVILYAVETDSEAVIGTSKKGIQLFSIDEQTNQATRPLTITELGTFNAAREIGLFSVAIQKAKYSLKTLPDYYELSVVDAQNGITYLVAVKKITWRSVNWSLIQFLDESDVYLPIKRTNLTTIIGVCATVGCSMLVGMLLAYWITRDLSRITLDLNKLKDFHFASVYKGRNNSIKTSNIKEIFQIQSSFHAMVEAFAKSLAINNSIKKGNGSIVSSLPYTNQQVEASRQL